MRIKYVGLAAIAASALLCLGLPAAAQEDVAVTFTGGYTTTFSNADGDFGAGIYSATINGSSSPGIICDDYEDEIYNNESWNAKAYQASSLAGGNINNVLFSSLGLPGYAEIGSLVSMMFDGATSLSFGGTTVSGVTQSALSAAIWDITTPGGISGVTPGTTAYALVMLVETEFGGNAAAAKAYLATLTNLWILTPDPLTGVGSGEPQEMWTENLSVPEGGAALMYLLLAASACFGAMFLESRKQAVSRVTA
jgi:hypothetical protein